MLDELEEMKTEEIGLFWANRVIAFWGHHYRDTQFPYRWGVIIEGKAAQREAPLLEDPLSPYTHPQARILAYWNEARTEERAREGARRKALEFLRALPKEWVEPEDLFPVE